MMEHAYLSLGSNLGQRQQHLEEAIEQIRLRIARPDRISGIYESEPWGFASPNPFYNCCISIRTGLKPPVLMERLLDIERDLGRQRTGLGYSDRLIDIDLLLYGDMKFNEPELILPHPGMAERRFVLAPLAEIAPGLIHPVTGLAILEMLRVCPDRSHVTLLS